jgi:hypothetical protein
VIPVLNAHVIRSVARRFWLRPLYDKVYPSFASGELRVRPLHEGTFGRAVNPYGTAVLARGWARVKRDRVPG